MAAPCLEDTAAPQFHDAVFRDLVEQSRVGIAILQNDRFVYANPKFADSFGYRPAEILRLRPRELVAPQDRALVADQVDRRLRGAVNEANYSFHGRRKDGSERIFEVHGTRMTLNGAPALISIVVDVRECELAEGLTSTGAADHAPADTTGDEFRNTVFRHLVEQSLIGISVIQERRYVYANPKFAEICGYTLEQILRMGPRDLVTDEDWPTVSEQLRKRESGEIKQSNYRVRLRRGDGAVRDVEVHGARMLLGNRPALISILVDVTERVRAEQELAASRALLQNLAIHDPLTGLYNRLFLDDALQRELQRARRRGRAISLVMADLDHFKRVNDTHGHQVGDRVLQAFARLLSEQTRSSDICCRYGGEEFLLILPETSRPTAAQRAEQVRAGLEALRIDADHGAIALTCSFGVAAYPEDGEDADTLVAAADRALYAAKTNGRNRVELSARQ